MTKEDAIDIIKSECYVFNPLNLDRSTMVNTALDMAVKALEQEPILDNIRAEIENDWQLEKYPSSPFACGLRRAIEIIDKYKAESEDKE